MPFQKGHKLSKNGGRKNLGLDLARAKLKMELINAVLADCENNQAKRLEWAKVFANKLFPNEIAGTGEGGALKVQVVNYGAGDRLQSSLQLATGTASLASIAESSEVQNDSVASEGKKDDAGNQ